MGKDAEFLDAARTGNIQVVEKVLNSKARRSGPLARLVGVDLNVLVCITKDILCIMHIFVKYKNAFPCNTSVNKH